MAEYSSELELCSFGLTKSFLKVRFLAMAEYSSELELCSFGLTKSFLKVRFLAKPKRASSLWSYGLTKSLVCPTRQSYSFFVNPLAMPCLFGTSAYFRSRPAASRFCHRLAENWPNVKMGNADLAVSREMLTFAIAKGRDRQSAASSFFSALGLGATTRRVVFSKPGPVKSKPSLKIFTPGPVNPARRVVTPGPGPENPKPGVVTELSLFYPFKG